MDDDIIVEHQAIKDGLAEIMEKEADNIARDDQNIRDSIQPDGRIISETEQECLNTVGSSLREDMLHKREMAAQLKGRVHIDDNGYAEGDR